MDNQLTIKEVKAQFHKEIHEGFRVKILIPDIGLYINGTRVYPPNAKHPDKWVVLTPSIMKTRIIELNPNLPLWGMIQKACIDAVSEYKLSNSTPSSSGTQGRDVVPEDIPDGPIDFSEIPF